MAQYRRDRASPWMVQIRDAAGKIKTRSFLRKEDALAFERKEKQKRQLTQAGLEAPKDEILFIDAVKSWLTKRSAGKASSFKQDQSRMKNYWIEPFGNYPLTLMTTALIKERLDYIQFELKHSPADRNRHRALLHKFFHDMFMSEKVETNPVIRIPLEEEDQKRRSAGLIMKESDQNAYIAALYEIGSQYGILGDLMLWTGARIMSAAAIQFRDVDFDLGVVRVRRLVERASRTIVERTKGKGELDEEVVPLFPKLRAAILARLRETEFDRPTDFIACGPEGNPIPYEHFMDIHNRAVVEAGVTRFTPHALRKAFATNAKRAGYTRAEIREMLGHSSEAVTALYDIKDIEHLVEKGKRLRFGSNQVSRLSAKKVGQKKGKGRRSA